MQQPIPACQSLYRHEAMKQHLANAACWAAACCRCDPVPMHTRPALSALLLLLLLPAAVQADSGWRQGWGLASTAPTPARPASAAPVRLHLEQQADQVRVSVEYDGTGPLQVRLRPRRGTQPGLPVLAILERSGRHALAILPADQGHDLLLEAVPGRPGAPPPPARYRLPFAQAPVRVHQAAGGLASHDDRENHHAWDFALAEGTPVLAARAGRVVDLVATATGPSGQRGDGGNWVRVLHADGSMAVYAHLQPASVAVRVGQNVESGQLLARSGNTGFSTAPHLHFVVQHNAGMQLASLPVQIHSPQGLLQAATGTGSSARL